MCPRLDGIDIGEEVKDGEEEEVGIALEGGGVKRVADARLLDPMQATSPGIALGVSGGCGAPQDPRIDDERWKEEEEEKEVDGGGDGRRSC